VLVLATCATATPTPASPPGFGIGTTTAWRYVQQAIDLLAALADDLKAAVARAAALAYAILDGTLIPIDRVADQKPYYARIRALGERALSTLNTWKVLESCAAAHAVDGLLPPR
jgi:hypothetical protein